MAKKKEVKRKRQTKRKPGRPLEPVPEKHVEAICEWVAEGETLEDYCRQPDTPSSRLVHHWLQKSDQFFSAYTRARAIGGDAIATSLLSLADQGDNDDVNHRRLQIETRKWLLARWFPTNYGDRLKHEHDANVSLTVVTGVPQPLDNPVPVDEAD